MIKNKKHQFLLLSSALLALISWGIAGYYWSRLPGTIPTHFNFAGQPDAWHNKSIAYSFLIPLLQTLMLGSFYFLYLKPHYSDMPTTLWLMTLPDSKKEHAFGLIRTMLVVVSIWIGVLFTYLTYMMNLSALNNKLGPNPWIMLGLIVSLLVWLAFWTVKVYKETKGLIGKTK